MNPVNTLFPAAYGVLRQPTLRKQNLLAALTAPAQAGLGALNDALLNLLALNLELLIGLVGP